MGKQAVGNVKDVAFRQDACLGEIERHETAALLAGHLADDLEVAGVKCAFHREARHALLLFGGEDLSQGSRLLHHHMLG